MNANYIQAPPTIPSVLQVGHLGARTTIVVRDNFGPDWFAFHIEACLYTTTVYLRRSELRALRDRLDEIDHAQPEVPS